MFGKETPLEIFLRSKVHQGKNRPVSPFGIRGGCALTKMFEKMEKDGLNEIFKLDQIKKNHATFCDNLLKNWINKTI